MGRLVFIKYEIRLLKMFSLRFVYVQQCMALRKGNCNQKISQRIIYIGVSNAVRFSYFSQMLHQPLDKNILNFKNKNI